MQSTPRRTIIVRLIAFLISIASLAWIALSFDLEELWQALQGANYWFLFPVCALIMLNFASRTTRWGTLFGVSSTPRWRLLYRALMVGYLANNILPARAGDLVRAYSLSREGQISGSSVLATVVVERVADLMITLILLGAAMLFFPLPEWSGSVGLLLTAISLGALIFLIVLNVKGSGLVEGITKRLKFLPQSFVQKIEATGKGFVKGVSQLRDVRRFLQFLGLTALIWLMEVGVAFLVAQAFDLPVGMADSLFVMLIIAIGMAVPSAPGFIGTFEFFGVTALELLGVAGGAALGFLIALHAVTFLSSSIIGAICLTLQSSRRIPAIDGIEID